MSDARDTLAILLLDLWRLPLADRPDAILSALSAAGYVVEQGWQDIATAPRDAMVLTAHVEDTAPILGYYHRGAWREHNGKATVICPTHWRPLPAPPAQEPQP